MKIDVGAYPSQDRTVLFLKGRRSYQEIELSRKQVAKLHRLLDEELDRYTEADAEAYGSWT